MDINILLFDDFETLDAFGPAEVFGGFEEYELKYLSLNGGAVISKQGAKIETLALNAIENHDVFFIPGGMGTRSLVNDAVFIEKIKEEAQKSQYVLTVCTGSALLGKTGLLDGIEATSNKKAFTFAETSGPLVKWIYKARWVKDGKYYTSSGVSAGIDMALDFAADTIGIKKAEERAAHIEYIWNKDKNYDPFAV